MFLPTNITLKFGDSGDFVAELQRRLSAVNCFNAEGINGFFDGPTVNGVSAFQTQSGIRADGIAGPETLRRLNGVISGDTSTTESHSNAEEEERKRQEELLRQQQQQILVEQQRQLEAQQQEAAMQQWQQQQAAAAPQPVQPEVSYAQPQAQYVPPAPQPPVQQPVIDPMAIANQQQVAENVQQQQQAQARVAAAPPPPPPRPPEPPQVEPINVQQQPQVAAPTPVQVITPQQQAAPVVAVAVAPPPPRPVTVEAAPPVQQQQQTTAVTPQEAPKGIVGRVTQYANEMVQKIANYLESKLPAPVLNEVKEIGQTMAKSGVKEVAIPAGPEQQRGADTPARGPQQQQAQIRS